LQHQDGHSLLLASTNPACIAYDPAFAFEVSVIVHAALRRMYGPNGENVFYYLTVYNEPARQPAAPEGLDQAALLAGLYRYQVSPLTNAPRAQVIASGSGMYAALRGAELLANDWGVAVDVWSATSWNELRREGLACDNHALLHPDEPPRIPWVTTALEGQPGPVIGVSDFMRAVPDQIAQWVPGDWSSLGTDGFGRSDTRAALRRHFEIDAAHIVVAVLAALVDQGEAKSEEVSDAIARYGIDADAPDPRTA
jgi:pyruvate dehydrogenase E1 component